MLLALRFELAGIIVAYLFVAEDEGLAIIVSITIATVIVVIAVD